MVDRIDEPEEDGGVLATVIALGALGHTSLDLSRPSELEPAAVRTQSPFRLG